MVSYIANWFFTDENDQLASKEHQDQICVLTKEAAAFLWDYDMKYGYRCTSKYFKDILTYDSSSSNQKSIKKFLFNIGIPFSQKVFISIQPNTGFVLTWKMVIKYSHNLFFGYDITLWDKTLNWKLDFDHNDKFTFCKNFILDGQLEAQKNREIVEKTLKEIEESNQN